MLASAQYSSTLVCSSFCLGKLCPCAQPVCHCASLPSPRAKVHFTVSLVKPAKKGLVCNRASIKTRPSPQFWLTLLSPLQILWPESCFAHFSSSFFPPGNKTWLWGVRLVGTHLYRNPLVFTVAVLLLVFLWVGKQHLWKTSSYYSRTLVRLPEEVVCLLSIKFRPRGLEHDKKKSMHLDVVHLKKTKRILFFF